MSLQAEATGRQGGKRTASRSPRSAKERHFAELTTAFRKIGSPPEAYVALQSLREMTPEEQCTPKASRTAEQVPAAVAPRSWTGQTVNPAESACPADHGAPTGLPQRGREVRHKLEASVFTPPMARAGSMDGGKSLQMARAVERVGQQEEEIKNLKALLLAASATNSGRDDKQQLLQQQAQQLHQQQQLQQQQQKELQGQVREQAAAQENIRAAGAALERQQAAAQSTGDHKLGTVVAAFQAEQTARQQALQQSMLESQAAMTKAMQETAQQTMQAMREMVQASSQQTLGMVNARLGEIEASTRDAHGNAEMRDRLARAEAGLATMRANIAQARDDRTRRGQEVTEENDDHLWSGNGGGESDDDCGGRQRFSNGASGARRNLPEPTSIRRGRRAGRPETPPPSDHGGSVELDEDSDSSPWHHRSRKDAKKDEVARLKREIERMREQLRTTQLERKRQQGRGRPSGPSDEPSDDDSGRSSSDDEYRQKGREKNSRGRNSDRVDDLNFGPFPSMRGLRNWRLDAFTQIVNATARPDEAAKWLSKTETARSPAALADSGRFRKLDGKIATMLCKLARTGASQRDSPETAGICREVLQAAERARLKGEVARGRQILWVLLERYKTDSDRHGGRFDYQDLERITLQGDNLEAFMLDWESGLMATAFEPCQKWLWSHFEEQCRRSVRLRDDFAHYQREADRRGADHCYEFLLETVRRHITRAQRDRNRSRQIGEEPNRGRNLHSNAVTEFSEGADGDATDGGGEFSPSKAETRRTKQEAKKAEASAAAQKGRTTTTDREDDKAVRSAAIALYTQGRGKDGKGGGKGGAKGEKGGKGAGKTGSGAGTPQDAALSDACRLQGLCIKFNTGGCSRTGCAYKHEYVEVGTDSRGGTPRRKHSPPGTPGGSEKPSLRYATDAMKTKARKTKAETGRAGECMHGKECDFIGCPFDHHPN